MGGDFASTPIHGYACLFRTPVFAACGELAVRGNRWLPCFPTRATVSAGGDLVAHRLMYDEDGNLSRSLLNADMNCDGSINPFDIQPFIDLVSGGPPCSVCAGDTNYDGTTNAFDIGNFTACIVDPVLGTESQREYVYGPEYVDELVCQIPGGAGVSPANPVYYLQDANYNVTGLVSGGGTGQPPAGTVLTQYVYEPYGQVLTIDAVTPESQPYNTVGHQGLFFEAFGAPLFGNSPLQPMAPGWYYNRNRWYSPVLERFTSRDPNETAMPVIAALAANAAMTHVATAAFDPRAHFAKGMNLFDFAGSNPQRRRDPSGLDWGYDSDIDSEISNRTGNALYALAAINEGARWASLGLKTALDIAASFLPGSGLYQAFKSVQVIAQGKGGFWDAINIAMVALPIAQKGLEAIGGFCGMLKAFGWGARSCHSFVAQTAVETAEGAMPIEALAPGDTVLTKDQGDPRAPARPGVVTQVFRSVSPAIVWITLASGAQLGCTPTHEVWSEAGGWTYAAALQPGQTFIDACGASVQIVDVQIDRTPTTVYNLEVLGASTFFAEGVWVHNNACTVLGHTADGYLQFAKLNGHNALDIPDAIWRQMSGPERWARNRAFPTRPLHEEMIFFCTRHIGTPMTERFLLRNYTTLRRRAICRAWMEDGWYHRKCDNMSMRG